MTYTTKDYKNYLGELKKIKEFDWVKNHLHLNKIPNFWTILEFGEEKEYGKRSAHEIRTSRMLRWLIDANETHNLGNVFAHKIMDSIGVKYPFHPEKNNMIKATAEEMDIDVFYKDYSQQMCLAIELKQYAKEGKYEDDTTQLDKYETLVTDLIKDADNPIQPYYIYLTPQKDDPSNKTWHSMGYQELINIIEDVLTEHVESSTCIYAADTKKIITDFKYDLQRSMDYTAMKNNKINTLLTDEEKKLTSILAEEIEHETNSKHLDQLIEIDQDDDVTELKELILITNKHIYTQDHSPNDRIRLLIRKIYNYLSADNQLDTSDLINYSKKDSTTPIKQQLKDQYGLTVNNIQITGGKGQGLYLLDENEEFQIYLSGESNGDFPNDYIHLLPTPNEDGKRLDAKHVPNRKFNLNDDFINENVIHYRREDKTITFDQLMTEHVMVAIKELNDQGITSL